MAKPDPYGAYEDETQANDTMTQREKKHFRSRKQVKGQRKKEKEQLHEIEEHTNQ